MITKGTLIIAMNLINEHNAQLHRMADKDAANTRHSNFAGATISKYSVPVAWADESQSMVLSM